MGYLRYAIDRSLFVNVLASGEVSVQFANREARVTRSSTGSG
jgi:hypothetical protein